MPIDLEQAIDVMKAALLARLGEEVDLIFQYGSFLKGSAHRYSDLDMSYVPVHDSSGSNLTVMVAGTLIDLYPMSWSTLESMANFENVSATLLLENRIVYQRSQAAAERFRALPERLKELQRPEARPEMLRKAQKLFKTTGYEIYLLREQKAAGHLTSCLLHAQQILNTVLHLLMICNQKVIDTRKMEQVLALPKLPAGLEGTLERIRMAVRPDELLAACETLLQTTRDLLVSEQREVFRSTARLPEVFDSAYPEFKADLQKLLLACERQDRLSLKNLLVSINKELTIRLAKVISGIEYSDFNSLAEYEQDLISLGFPVFMPYLSANSGDMDFNGLAEQVLVFDRRLREFLGEHGSGLNSFDSLDELKEYLQ